MINTSKYDMDAVVVGGGTAGVSTALSAARNGLRTLLLESQISLGGLATNCYVTGIAGNIEGNCMEWLDRLEAEGGLIRRPHAPMIDPEKGKFMLERMLLEAGARILYGAYIIDAEVEDSRIKNVICHSKSGRMAVSSRMFIDASGDADVANYAGVPCETGGPEFAGLNMSTTLAFRMANVNMTKYGQAMQEWRAKEAEKYRVPVKMTVMTDLVEEAVKNGDLPYYVFPVALIYQIPGTTAEDADISVMTCHSFFPRNNDVEDLTRQIIEQHQQVGWMEKFFRKYVPGFEKARVIGLASILGVRESRRIVGEYMFSDEDLACGAKFDDAVMKFPEFFDTHHPTNSRLGFMRHVHLKEPKGSAVCRPAQCSGDIHPFVKLGGYEARTNPRDYCEVPYRSLVPLKIDNLLVAGRCVSAEFNACTATRLIGPCMSTGQACGIAAGMCLKEGITPRELDGKLVRKAMIEQGVPLDKPLEGHWAEMKKPVEGEPVVLPGDFAGILTPDGKTQM
ncbi:MAG: FAD-dependent oxidoreductase [Dehalococcoidales bacterium]|nr:FAD-dependent oxidoreductase [Dehalococcoidales bacterium]